jgi:hypothetical protein
MRWDDVIAPKSERPGWTWCLWPNVVLMLVASLCAYAGLLPPALFAIPELDKLLHFGLYGGLAFGLVGWCTQRTTPILLGVLSVAVVVEEMLQSLSALRTFDRLDMLASISGILVFGCLASWARRRPPWRISGPPGIDRTFPGDR